MLPYTAIAERLEELEDNATLVVVVPQCAGFDRVAVGQSVRAVLRQHGMFARLRWSGRLLRITKHGAALYTREERKRGSGAEKG